MADRSTDTSTEAYDVHGVTLALRGDLPAVGLLHSRFKAFPRRITPQADLVFEFSGGHPGGSGRSPDPPGAGRELYALPGGSITYCDGRDELYMTGRPGVSVRCDAERGRTWISVTGSSATSQWAAAHAFFQLPFIELLRSRSRYNLHAAGVCVDGRGLILAGASGCGKTTLAYVLLRAGFVFLGDDTLFLGRGPAGLKILAFPDELDMTSNTGRLFPALQGLTTAALPDGGPKHALRLEDLNPSCAIAWECRPGVVVFPKISDIAESRLSPINHEEALVELMPNIILTQPARCQAHFDALGQLVRQSDCYRLDTGRDFDRLPRLLGGLLAR